MSRTFNGSGGNDQQLILDVGNITSDGGPITVLTLWRPSDEIGGTLVSGIASGATTWGYIEGGDGKYYTRGDFSGAALVDSGQWQIIGYTKANGSAAVRWHFRDSSGSWTRTNGSTIADQGAPTSIRIGNGLGDLAGLRLDGDWVCSAVWDSALSDGAVEAAGSLTGLQAWADASPTALWDGNQSSTSDPVVDRTGGGADEISAPSTGSPPGVGGPVPPGWSYTISSGSTLAVTEAPDTLAAAGTVSPPTTPYKVADRGSAQNLTNSTTTAVDLPAAGSIAVGNVLIARLAMDNSGLNGAATTVDITDPRGNTWTVGAAANQDPGAANAGISCRIAYCVVANAYTDGDDLTITFGNSTPADATVVEEWANLNVASLVAVAQVTANGGSATPSVSVTPGAAGQLVYGALGIEGPAGDTYTQDADTTDGVWSTLTSLSTASGTAASNATIRGAYKLVTGTTAQTWNPSITNRDWAAVAVVFNPVPTPIAGSLARTEAPDTLAAAGTSASPGSTGSLAETEQNDQIAASGTVTAPPVTGSLGQAEAPDALAAAGTFTPAPVSGSLSEAEAADTLAATGTTVAPIVAGSIDATEAPDALNAAGTHTSPGFTGSVAVTEQDDQLAAAGTVTAPTFTGTLAVAEADDTLAGTGTAAAPVLAGTLAVTEAADVLAAAGTVVNLGIAGNLAVTEAPDALSAAGTHTAPVFVGSLAAVEANDDLAASGQAAASTSTGSLTVVEASDQLAAAGSAVPPVIVGVLAIVEADDTLSAFESIPATGGTASTVAVETPTAAGIAGRVSSMTAVAPRVPTAGGVA